MTSSARCQSRSRSCSAAGRAAATCTRRTTGCRIAIRGATGLSRWQALVLIGTLLVMLALAPGCGRPAAPEQTAPDEQAMAVAVERTLTALAPTGTLGPTEQPGPSATETRIPTPTPSPAPSRTPIPTRTPTAAPTPAAPVVIPAGWLTYVSAANTYAISYPAAWQVEDADDRGAVFKREEDFAVASFTFLDLGPFFSLGVAAQPLIETTLQHFEDYVKRNLKPGEAILDTEYWNDGGISGCTIDTLTTESADATALPAASRYESAVHPTGMTAQGLYSRLDAVTLNAGEQETLRGVLTSVRRGADPAHTATPPPTAALIPTPKVVCVLASAYVRDVTIPDGTQLDPGAAFVKTWEIRNSGNCSWPEGTRLTHVSGNEMGSPDDVLVTAVAPGVSTEVSVKMVAPKEAGRYRGTWQLSDRDGNVFGAVVTVDIRSGAPVASAPAAPAPVSGSFGSESEFIAYLAANYGTIAGAGLEIEDVFIAEEFVSIELTRDSALYVFADQTEADATAYAQRLLEDTIAYFWSSDCSAYVSDSYYTRNLRDYMFGSDWYYIGDYRVGDGWFVNHTYVRAHYLDGRKSIEVWNYR